ncbi:putative outer membrane lipoprotein [Rickettsiales bacterium Ac37b]|nr:putative outer membrane lipoprotein [Rickettsiales bacterium Ac37b]
MWYFTWVLGLGLACTFSILNAIWLEMRLTEESESKTTKIIIEP